jgi:hypothetical protein
VFSAYIYIDNLANPYDRKYIRVSIEVVLEHASVLRAPGDKDTEWFSVLIPEWFASEDVEGLEGQRVREQGSWSGSKGVGGASMTQPLRQADKSDLLSDIVGAQRSPLVNLGQVIAITLNPKPETRNPKPETLNPKP